MKKLLDFTIVVGLIVLAFCLGGALVNHVHVVTDELVKELNVSINEVQTTIPTWKFWKAEEMEKEVKELRRQKMAEVVASFRERRPWYDKYLIDWITENGIRMKSNV